ncbi:MAG: isoprenyl transferase [Rickettsiales bacterium]|nr:isoprenyl transferase [Rickettsiales bacterium]
MFFCRGKTADLKIPTHIAIIMDGNARWAKSKGLPLKVGHKLGSENVRKIAESCIEIGVKHLTIYAFSSENWDRPEEEVTYLMKLLDEYLEKETKPLIEKDIRILISGNLEKLPQSTKDKIAAIESQTKNNKALTLNVAFSYGSRQEIVDAAKKLALAVSQGKNSVAEIDEKLFAQNLYNPEIPDPDLLIRTAGDLRLSNFLLWQLAYAEFHFTKTYWPDFSKKHLLQAISEFNKRERRYGKR